MGLNAISYAGNLGQDTRRGPSEGIWGSCPWDSLRSDPYLGQTFWEDFNGFPQYGLYNGERTIGQWQAWIGNNSGAIIGPGADTTNLPLEGDVLGLYGGTTAIDITMCAGSGSNRFVTSATGNAMLAGAKMWFEASVSFGVATSAYGDMFVGLMDRGDAAGTRITSAASLCFSSTNTLKTATGNGACLGFWKRATTNPGDWRAVFNANNGTVQTPSSGVSATAGLGKILTNSGVTGLTSGLVAMSSTSGVAAAQVFNKFGFIYDPTASCPQKRAAEATTANQVSGTLYTARVRFFLNGQELPWFLNTADVQATTFPLTFLCPTIGYRSGGTGAGIGYVDFVRCAQLASF